MRLVATSADGIRLVYEVHGTGTPALVFVHGWSCDRSYWDGQVRLFARRFQVVTVDLAGHGDSGRGRERWTMASFGADVAAVADALGLEGMVLIGHSMGGDVVVEAARRLPGRVRAMIWVDTYRELANPLTHAQVLDKLVPFRTDFVQRTRTLVRGMFPSGADRALVERVAADMSAAPLDVALGAAESAWSCGREVAFAVKELGLPCVTINPEEPPTDVGSMERAGVEVVFMSGVGHFPMLENPQGFNTLLMQVVERFVP
jgi:pimeloyl-ACP methyl ester carboxylesterase